MLDKNKISVLTKMIGVGDEKPPQLIVPQNSLSNLHARLGLTEKSLNIASGQNEEHAPPISCPHCQSMAKNFLYLESLIRANSGGKHKCSLCSSTLRYVEYVNKSILDVFAKNATIIEAAKTYSAAKPRFRIQKNVTDTRLKAGTKKSSSQVPTNASNNNYVPTDKLDSTTLKIIKQNRKLIDSIVGKSSVQRTPKQLNKPNEKTKKPSGSREKISKPPKETVKGAIRNNKSAIQFMKNIGVRFSTRSPERVAERNPPKTKKCKCIKVKKGTSSTNTKKNQLKVKSSTSK